jgi:hypothetical protein
MHSEPRDAVRAWVRTKARDPEGIEDTTPLFEERHLMSLHVPELLLLLERLRGAPIDPTGLRPGDFHDIDTIVGRFCGGV